MCYGVRIEIGTNGERKSSTIDNDLTTREEWMLVYVIALFLHYETAVLLLGFITIAEEAVDFPCGFAVAEEATVFLLVLRSLETGELPLGSIGMIV
ncbi:hypothetical protein Bca52824_006148 [Brassica carinata]|uniref:Uncharacterized protein n=1 Tax=Brassica carinata TaxID=52824 RepID=A0A8X7WQ40_BRACI|nr:hypothetical protein Bca52824_006148 [Brassica carinata]